MLLVHCHIPDRFSFLWHHCDHCDMVGYVIVACYIIVTVYFNFFAQIFLERTGALCLWGCIRGCIFILDETFLLTANLIFIQSQKNKLYVRLLIYYYISTWKKLRYVSDLVHDNFILVATDDVHCIAQLDIPAQQVHIFDTALDMAMVIHVAYDPVEEKVIWFDILHGTISRARLDGSDAKVLVHTKGNWDVLLFYFNISTQLHIRVVANSHQKKTNFEQHPLWL